MLRKFWEEISYAGLNADDMSFGSKRQMIFNRLNFLAIVSCIIRIAFMSITVSRPFTIACFLGCLIPVAISAVAGLLVISGRFNTSKFISFLLFPPAIAFIAYQQQDYGLSIFPLLFCILAFFFLDGKKAVVAAFLNGAACFMAIRFLELIHADRAAFYSGLPLLVFNHLLILSLIYLLLNFIKAVVKSYQKKLALHGHKLAGTNAGLLAYQEEILEKTAQLEARQQLLEKTNRQKNKMLSIISHDLRTPIQSVRNLLDLHEKEIMSDEELINYMPEVKREMSNVTDLLENLLAWSRQLEDNQEIKKEKIQLEPLVLEVCRLYQFYAKGKSVQLVTEMPPVLEITADRQMIRTVLRNMVSNAIKFSNPGGRVMINAAVTGNEIRISVSDEGRGITPGHIARIINGEELTTKGTNGEYGSGLGLGLCREFIHKNKGQLYITSTPGLGSTFTVTLPLEPAPQFLPAGSELKTGMVLHASRPKA